MADIVVSHLESPGLIHGRQGRIYGGGRTGPNPLQKEKNKKKINKKDSI